MVYQGRNKWKCWPVALCLLMLSTGCVSSITQKKDLDQFNSLYASGQYKAAADCVKAEESEGPADPADLLTSLQAGVALRQTGNYDESSRLFDDCEEIIKHHNEKYLIEKSTATIGATLVNDAILDYRGTEYDGVMVNTYKAMNFWQQGKHDLARIEFNRALDRQRRAKERFAAEIAKMKEEIKAQEEEKNAKAKNQKTSLPKLDIKKSIHNPEIENILKEKYSNLYEYQTYPDFVNPFTTYLAGLFFWSQGDLSKAVDLLKETYGMVDKNPVVMDDFAGVEKRLNGKKAKQAHTWVIFENGMGPQKEELRVDLPLLLLTDKVHYTGIALPKLAFRDRAYPYLEINGKNGEVEKTSLLACMDKVVKTEFKKKYKIVVTRAVVSALLKTYGQYMAEKKLGSVGGLLAAAYQGATTSADIRMWTGLPKEFQLAKIKTPKQGDLVLTPPGGEKIKVKLPPEKNVLIYVKISSANSPAVVDTIVM
ncbi:MAG: hypothetical protein MI802_16160 [Desulfobacterales bacterium]|nr:hypothetical protein [Desulfobacterales bacterium]